MFTPFVRAGVHTESETPSPLGTSYRQAEGGDEGWINYSAILLGGWWDYLFTIFVMISFLEMDILDFMFEQGNTLGALIYLNILFVIHCIRHDLRRILILRIWISRSGHLYCKA